MSEREANEFMASALRALVCPADLMRLFLCCRCLLSAVCCLLSAVCCQLSAVCCLLYWVLSKYAVRQHAGRIWEEWQERLMARRRCSIASEAETKQTEWTKLIRAKAPMI
jgi:hypothetical protein